MSADSSPHYLGALLVAALLNSAGRPSAADDPAPLRAAADRVGSSLIRRAARQSLRAPRSDRPGRARVQPTEFQAKAPHEGASSYPVLQQAPPAADPDGNHSAPQSSAASELPFPITAAGNHYSLDLATAWRLAGGSNLQIALAAERVRQALAVQRGAEVLWVPSVRAGVGYNAHTGQLQATEGDVIEVNRESLYVGGGAGFGGAPLNGGAGGPARLFVDLSPVDAYFEPLAARQVTRAVQSDHSAVFNDTLLAATIAYLDLVRAQSEHAIAEYAVNQAQELARIADDQARTGRGLPADAERARAELSSRRRLRSSARERVQVVSAELARILRLEAGVVLFATDVQPMPVEVIDTHAAVLGLIALAWAARPELARQSWTANAAAQRVQQETLRPWVPNLHVGLTTGGFGGGAGEFFGDFSDRSDFDALLVWEFQNLGLGNRARRQEQESIQRQAHLEYARLRDIVAAEVVQAYEQVHYRREQIDEAKLQMRAAAEALPLNFTGILAAELRVIEAQQAISALADAQSDYVAAITDYNRAQFTLLRAIGRPPGSAAN